jgi:ribonuclease P protein component
MYPKSHRLSLSNRHHLSGPKLNLKSATLIYQPNQFTHLRVAVIVSKKVSPKAVVRNQAKRRFLHATKKAINPQLSLDLLFILKPSILDHTFNQLTQELAQINHLSTPPQPTP